MEEFTKSLAERFDANEREFNGKLDELKRITKERFEALESEISITKTSNRLLAEEVKRGRDISRKCQVKIEREAYRTAEYTQYETLELSQIPLSIPDKEVQQLTLAIFNSLKNENNPYLVPADLKACHRRQGKYARETVMCKFVRRGHAFDVMATKSGLKDLDLKTIDERLTETVYINEHLSPYYSKLRYMCKKLWQAGMLSKFWVAGHKIKAVITEGDDVIMITHV